MILVCMVRRDDAHAQTWEIECDNGREFIDMTDRSSGSMRYPTGVRQRQLYYACMTGALAAGDSRRIRARRRYAPWISILLGITCQLLRRSERRSQVRIPQSDGCAFDRGHGWDVGW